MKSDTPLDYAIFQLSPKRSRCELYVSSGGNTEKLASGLVKPFVSHLKIAEEQTASMVPSIKLEVGKFKNAETWFTKGTLERFVRFVSTPEILELVNTFDAEMSQLEAARKIYSQGTEDPPTSSSSGDGAVAAADATKKELLRAIDVRLAAVSQDLTTSYTRAVSAGFTPDAVSELQLFADQFGASRLKESCSKFICLCDKRPDLINPWKTGVDDQALRSSCGSDMSIDEDPPEEQSKPATWQKPTKPSSLIAFSIRRSRESSVDREEVKESEEKKEESANKEEPPVKTSQHIRRLSVQDRINLFENKQKESSGSSGGKPVVVGKSAELRRLSSDVSSAPEKAVLRRWSGVSDMSISLDLTGERRDFESPVCTPSSSSVSHTKSEEIKSKTNVNKDGEDGAKQEKIIETKAATDSLAMSISTSSGFRPDASEANKLSSTLERLESDFRKFQTGSKSQIKTQIPTQTQTQPRSSRVEEDSLKNKLTFQPQVRSDERVEQIGLADQKSFKASMYSEVHGDIEEQAASERQNKISGFKQDKFDSLDSQLQEVSFKEVDEEKKETRSSHRLNVAREVKFQKQGSLAEQIKRSQTKREEKNLDFTYSKPTSSKMVSEDFVTASAVPVEQVQKAKQAKGNQELNDELKIKANELEKLFAEHKRRVGPAEQSISGRGNDKSDNQMEQEMSLLSRKHTRQMVETQPALLLEKKTSTESIRTLSNMSSYCVTPPVRPSSNHSEGESLKNEFSELGRSDDSRGQLYDKYTQKRDAKLREDWGSNRAEKEAKMKALQDSFERSQVELETKFSGSAYKQGLALSSKRHAERLRSFNTRSNMKRGQHPIDFLQDETEGDLSDLVEKTPSGHARSLSETSLGDDIAKTAQTRKPLPNKTNSSSTSRTSALPVLKSGAKASNNSYLRRKTQSENPLAQSVPNFSDLKKENTKPISGTTKPTRLQARTNSRNRNTTEENPLVKDEKSKRSHSLRKSSFGTAEFKEWSPLDSDSANLNAIKIDKQQSEGTKKDFESKTFLRKGSGVGPGAGTLMAKMKASMASEISKNEEGDFEVEELDTTKYEEEEEEEQEPEAIITEDHEDNDNGKPRLSQDSGSESGEALRSFSQIDPSFAVESPVSWNSRMQHAFSYANETSDVDASADSPLGSPASWNQAEADAARMRKKWGRAEKPFVSSSTLAHPRKDVTKGFKRLLKFGRKSRGTDSLVDWISATTSEGDDDTEDGRDLANRSSEDLRKSRMGFSQVHTPDDVFNESDFYTEQAQALRSSIPAPPAHFKLREDQLSGSSIKAPRSFFSLSSFRSKANDSKPR